MTNHFRISNVNNTTIISGNTTLYSDLNIFGNVTINSNLNILNNAIFNDDITLISNLNVYGTANITSLQVFNDTYLENVFISGNTIIQNQVSLLSNINILGDTILNNQVTILSDINISGSTIINNNTTLLSNLSISGNTTFLNTLTLVNLTEAERNAIINPSPGELIYNITSQKLNIYANGFWNEISNTDTLSIVGATTLTGEVTLSSTLNVISNTILSALRTVLS
jgi:UDP-3-O-[3-hydroxymyristoyl] glucosamine N-acyltransferase